MNAGPRPVQKCHEHAEAHPLTTAGPRALAGLMHMELTGPSTHMSNAMARATARGPNLPQPLHASTGRSLWQQHFSRAACNSSSVLRRQGLAGKHSSENHRRNHRKLHTGEAQILSIRDARLATLKKNSHIGSGQPV